MHFPNTFELYFAMSNDDEKPTSKHRIDWVISVIGIGLILVGGLEYFGLTGYRTNRQPVGAVMWLAAGGVCLLIGFVTGRLRK